MVYSAGNPKPLKKRLQDIKVEAGVSYEAGEIEAVKGGLANKTDKIYMFGSKEATKAVVDGYTPPPTPPTPPTPTEQKWKANLKGVANDVSYDSTVTIKAVEPAEEDIVLTLKQNGGNVKQKLVTPTTLKFGTSLNGSGAQELKMVLTPYNFITNDNGYLLVRFNNGTQAHLFKDGKAIKASAISVVETKADTPTPPVEPADESVANIKMSPNLISDDGKVIIEATEPKMTIEFILAQNGGNVKQKTVSPTGYKFGTSLNGANTSDLKLILTAFNFITNDKGYLCIVFNDGKNTAHLFKDGVAIKAKSIKFEKKETEPEVPLPATESKKYADIDNSKKLFGSQIKQTANFKITGTNIPNNEEVTFKIAGTGKPNYQVTPNGYYWDGSSGALTMLNTAYDFFIDENGYFKLYANNTEFFIYSSKNKNDTTKVKVASIVNLAASSDEEAQQ